MNSLSLPRRRRRGLVAVVAALGVAATSFGLLQTADAAPSRVKIAVTDPVVGGDRAVSVRLTCGTAAACRGTVRLTAAAKASKTNARISTRAVSFSIKKKASRTVKLSLTAAQATSLGTAGRARVAVQVKGAGKLKATSRTTLRPATAALRVATRTAKVGADRRIALAVSCSAATTCRGTIAPVLGSTGAAKAFSVAAGRSTTLPVTLTTAQAAKITAKGTTVAFKIAESAPERVAATAYVTVSTTATADTNVYSVAYTLRAWVPTQYDTCPADLHKTYSVTGPDGKIYPTWHPAQVTDPATGKLCTFGHEHGTDPKTSDIYTWVANYLDNGQNASNKGIPFGYVSERLEDYGKTHAGMQMRHEDNGGHKMAVANNVTLLDADRTVVTDTQGAPVVCDYLIKYHQGSWSPDATSNNAHELIYAVKCTDGTEMITSTLSRYGNSNEFNKNCDYAPADKELKLGPIVTTKNSGLPAGDGGARSIPDSTCVAKNATGANAGLWGVYELWSSGNQLTTTDGQVLAAYDPWFGVRNPSRYYDPSKATDSAPNGVARTVDLAWGDNAAQGYPWSTVKDVDPFDYRDPRSPFDGSQRDFYLNQSQVTSVATALGQTVYTNPYGKDASVTPTDGAVKQHLVAGTRATVTLSTQVFDKSKDFGADVQGNSNGVHAPN